MPGWRIVCGKSSQCGVWTCVPKRDNRRLSAVVFVPKNVKRSCVEQEPLRVAHGQSNPTGRHHSAEVTVGEERDVSSQRAKTGN
jgi:hypothetical protein